MRYNKTRYETSYFKSTEFPIVFRMFESLSLTAVFLLKFLEILQSNLTIWRLCGIIKTRITVNYSHSEMAVNMDLLLFLKRSLLTFNKNLISTCLVST